MYRPTSCLLGLLLLAGAAHAQTPYLGEIRCGLWNFAPKGWALLQGQTLSINQNQAMFDRFQATAAGAASALGSTGSAAPTFTASCSTRCAGSPHFACASWW